MPRKRNAKAIAKSDQSLANLRLKQDDDSDTDVQQPVAENELQCSQILFDGKPVEENEGGNTERHGSGTSSAQEFQDSIHQQKDKDDVRDIARFNSSS